MPACKDLIERIVAEAEKKLEEVNKQRFPGDGKDALP
jgi:hypothetical protein